MKKIVASVGLVAISAATLNAAYTQGLSELETKKPWSVGLTLRGFYDDNIESTHDNKIDSFGYEVNPWLGVHWVGDQTLAGASYTYSGKYYEQPRPDTDSKWSQSHIFDVMAQHAFSPRYNVSARDSFVIGQEPDLLRAGDSATGLQRINGNNIRNYGNVVFNAQVTKVFGLSVSYANSYWNYDDSGADYSSTGISSIQGSYSGLLDRVENAPQIDARWQLSPQTVGLIGYRFRDVNYTGDEYVGGIAVGGVPAFSLVTSDERNFRSQYGYAGIEHNFRPDLFGSLRAGVVATDNYNDPNGTTGLGPYVSANLTYEYTADTSFGIGFSQDFSTSDQIGNPTDFVRGVDNSVVYLWFRHRLAPSLYLSGQGTFQYSVYNGGGDNYDGKTDQFLLGNITLEYWFDKHLSAHVGYNIDYLDSQIPNRGYTRNRVYIGLSATY